MGSLSKTVNHLIMFFVVKKTNITTKRFINSNPLTSKLINASREIVFARNSNINDSFGNVTLVNFHPSFTLNPMDKDFYKVAFSAAIFMFIALLITIVANSFLLLVLYIDSSRMFRNPTSYFLLGLAITDLLTALVQGTVLATLYVFLYLQHPYSIKLATSLNDFQTFTEYYITTSNSTIFAFTLTQFSVVSSPLKYGRLVTRKKSAFNCASNISLLWDYLVFSMVWYSAWRLPSHSRLCICRHQYQHLRYVASSYKKKDGQRTIA